MSFLYSGDDPSFVTYFFGLVSSRVAGMQLQLSDGDVKVIDIVPGPKGLDVGFFVFFPPPSVTGVVVLMDAKEQSWQPNLSVRCHQPTPRRQLGGMCR